LPVARQSRLPYPSALSAGLGKQVTQVGCIDVA
jgi:hypothetical protein